MNLKFLETFIWVAKLHSFSLAAEKLHSTQAAISSRISVLEQELGTKLFNREPKGVTLTRAGERVLHHAEIVSRSMLELYASVQDENLAASTIRIGAMDSAIHSWFVDFVADATHHYPNLDIEVTTETALNLNERLRHGMLDLVIQTDMVRDESLRSIEVLELSIDWIAAADADTRSNDDGRAAPDRRGASHHLLAPFPPASGFAAADAVIRRERCAGKLRQFARGDDPAHASRLRRRGHALRARLGLAGQGRASQARGDGDAAAAAVRHRLAHGRQPGGTSRRNRHANRAQIRAARRRRRRSRPRLIARLPSMLRHAPKKAYALP